MSIPKLFDRVKETTVTTGTGDITLAGAATGYQAFADVLAVDETTYYTIAAGAEWEIGMGTLTDTDTLERSVVLDSSNDGSLVDFSAGTKSVFITAPAALLSVTKSVALTFISDTGATADSDPGNGKLRWNHATQASATSLFLDDQTADGVSLPTFYSNLGAGGIIRLQQADDSTKWQQWRYTAATVDGTGYRKFTVALMASGGSIADGKTVFADITPQSTEFRALTFTSDTASQADSDPGNGKLRWNHATQASATSLFLDDQTADGVSLTTLYGNLGAAGIIHLQQADDPSKWQVWRYTAATVDGTGYRKFTVALMANGGSIADGKTVFVHITPQSTEFRALTFTSDTASQADSDPGNGKLRWNHATQASATSLFLDDQTADGVSLPTLWGNLGITGVIHLQQADDPAKWQLWRWTQAAVDGTGYRKFTVALMASGGSIADGKTVFVTLTNDRTFVPPRTATITSGSAPTPNADTTDVYTVTALAEEATFGAPTGTPVQGQGLVIRIKDDGTSRAIGWNGIYRAIGVTLPSATTIGKTLYVGMLYNSTDTKWDVLAVKEQA